MLLFPCAILDMPEGDDRQYMERLYTENHRLMDSVARRYCGEPSAIDDIISDACLALIAHVGTLRSLESAQVKAYIVSSVRNTAYNYNSRFRRERERTEDIGDERIDDIADETDIEKKIQLREEIEQVWKAISRLSESEKTVMRMRYALRMTDDQIAQKLGQSESAVRKHVSRARVKIKAMVYGE